MVLHDKIVAPASRGEVIVMDESKLSGAADTRSPCRWSCFGPVTLRRGLREAGKAPNGVAGTSGDAEG